MPVAPKRFAVLPLAAVFALAPLGAPAQNLPTPPPGTTLAPVPESATTMSDKALKQIQALEAANPLERAAPCRDRCSYGKFHAFEHPCHQNAG